MSSRWIGLFVWALVAACVAAWGLKIFAAPHPVPPGALVPVPPVATTGPMVRLFGAVQAPAADEQPQQEQSDRFQLVGVIAPRAGSSGIAIVAVDGQPPKPWKVGAALEGDTTLLAVARRSADFGPPGGPASFTLELPAPAAPATGTLPAAVSQPVAPQPGLRSPVAAPGTQMMRPNTLAPLGGRPGFAVNPALRPGVANPVLPGNNPVLQGGVQVGRPAPAPGQVPGQDEDPNAREE